MGQVVVTGGTAQCTFGTLPGMISAGTQKKVLIDGKPVATIMDFNTQCITPFGLCTTLTNPAVQAATTAALGVLTPQPCTLVPAGTWKPTKVTVQAGGSPVLTNECQGTCVYGGCIAVTNPGQSKVIV